MGVRVTVGGKVVYQRDVRKRTVCAPEYDEAGEQRFFHGVVSGAQSPIEDEVVVESRVRYRVVDEHVLRPDHGWGAGVYWCRELKISLAQLHRLTRKGFFDAAVARQSGVQRYRCLDYRKTTQYIRSRKVDTDE